MSNEKLTPVNPYSRMYTNPYAAKTTKKAEMAEFSQLMMSMFSGLGDSSDSNTSDTSVDPMMSMFSGLGDSSKTASSGTGLNSMMSLMMKGLDGGSGSSSSSGTSLKTMMMPLMMSLLEKLQASQMEPAASSDAAATGMPVEGGVLTQDFNADHHALDFGIPEGTPVKSTMAGKVVYSGWNDQGYGNLVIVENGSRRTYYAHLSELPVNQGDSVKEGDVIGISGSTGNSTGPHLHYEIRENGMTVDPTEEVFGKNNSIV
jgi:biotin carboxyl carrier protein